MLSDEIMDHPDENHMLLDQMESIQQIKFSPLENSIHRKIKRRAAKSSDGVMFFFVAYQSTCIQSRH